MSFHVIPCLGLGLQYQIVPIQVLDLAQIATFTFACSGHNSRAIQTAANGNLDMLFSAMVGKPQFSDQASNVRLPQTPRPLPPRSPQR
jgi:hypothetical protein